MSRFSPVVFIKTTKAKARTATIPFSNNPPPTAASPVTENIRKETGLARLEMDCSFARMNHLERITFNPDQCGGRPCIRGMRIRVKDVLDMLAAGASEAEILESYPYLEREDIQASLQYAAAQVDHAVLTIAR